MPATYKITLTRNDPYVTSFDIYAKSGGYPIEPGDGLYLGNTPIDPFFSNAIANYTLPAAGLWFFIAVPFAMDRQGPFGRLG